MKASRSIFLVFLLLCQGATGQLLYWSPEFPRDTSSSFSVIADAAFGNKGLLNFSSPNDVYVHTGVITNLSATATDWRYVKFNQNFNVPNDQLRTVYLGNNRWRFDFSGNIRSYYAVPSGENILKIAILFRSGNGSAVLRNADGSDMYIPVAGNPFDCRITNPFRQPTFFQRPEPLQPNIGDTVSFSGVSSRNAQLSLFFNGSQIATAPAASQLRAQPPPQISSGGNQTLVLKADDGFSVIYDTFSFYVPGPGAVAPLPAGVQDGINYEPGDTSVTLVLFAPGKQRVCIIGDLPGSNWEEREAYQMNKTPDGKYWWLRIRGLVPGIEYSYQYLINGSFRTADPYADKLLDPWHDQFISSSTYPGLKPYPAGLTTEVVSVLQTAAPRYLWTAAGYVRPDKKKLIIYELLLRDFIADHNWNKLSDSLDYLSRLGINAIQLMPFNEFEGNISWGYNPSFYSAPDKYYGKANDLKRFVDLCHARGIAVIMDIALNHAFGQSPMVRMYWDAAAGRPAADNPWFNPVAKHGFSVGYDFNHESLATRYFSARVLKHWLQEYRIDGFRFDLSKGFTQRKTCDDNGNNCDIAAWGAFDQSRIDILSRYYDSMQLYVPGSIAILEHFAENSEETILSSRGFLLWGNMNSNYIQASTGYASNSDVSYGLHTSRGWTSPHLITYMESHDEERINYKNLQSGNSNAGYSVRDSNTAHERMALSHVMLLTQPGPKMIWQFGELGYDYSINHCENGTVNNACRTDPKPIRWNYLRQEGRRKIFNAISDINRLRRHPAFSELFVSGTVTSDLTGLIKWLKLSSSTGEGLLVMGNFDITNRSLSVSFPSAGTWYNYLEPPDSITASGGNRNFTLRPGEYRVYINRFIPLPGTIFRFEGTANGLINQLDWQLLEEQSVTEYELQRSFDSINFITIHRGNATGIGNYRFDDNVGALSSSVHYYRLKVNVRDGSFRQSRILRLENAAPPANDFSATVQPNPFSGAMNLSVSSPQQQSISIIITDIAGRMLFRQQTQLTGGANQLRLPATSSFAAGMYFVRLITGNKNLTIPVLKSK